MSIFSDLGNAPKDLKSMLIPSILIPFWYITFYIFHPVFYHDNEFILILSFCICLTISSSMVGTFFMSYSEDTSKLFLDEDNLRRSTYASLIIHAGLIFAGYTWSLIFHEIFLFYSFLITYFVLLILFLVIVVFSKSPKSKIQ